MSEHAMGPAAGRSEPAPDQLSEHYIEAQTSLVERALRTLKAGDAFAVLDTNGDCGSVPDSPEGLFFQDTRYLSRFELRFEGKRPLLLGSAIQDDNAALTVDLTNPDIRPGEDTALPRDIIALNRTKFLWQGVLHERIGLRNYDGQRRVFHLECRFDADFRDLFEVRGMQRAQRGTTSVKTLGPDRVAFSYNGLDGIVRQTMLRFEPWPTRIESHRVVYEMSLEPDERRSILITIACDETEAGQPLDSDEANFLRGYRDTRRALRAATSGMTRVETSNHLFNEVIARSSSDMYMLVTPTEHGLYPYAGIPWYSTVFGRDGIITAMMLLWADPSIARGVLRYLAACRPRTSILLRMLSLARSYMSAAWVRWLSWVKCHSAATTAPSTQRRSSSCWRANTTTARATARPLRRSGRISRRLCGGAISLVTVMAMASSSIIGRRRRGWPIRDGRTATTRSSTPMDQGLKVPSLVRGTSLCLCGQAGGGAACADLHRHDLSARLAQEAELLRERFEAAFWCEELGTYALALDGAKRPCRVRTSNAGHALFAGIAAPERARRVAATLMSPDSFSGWGIRTRCAGRIALQSDVLPQWLDLAA